MTNGLVDILAIKEKFKKEFMLNGNNEDFYLFYVGLDKKGWVDPDANIESLDEVCLTAYVQRGRECPPGLKIPNEYHGIRVYRISSLVGEIPSQLEL